MNAQFEKEKISKVSIASSFGRAATSYDNYAELQRKVVDDLSVWLSPCSDELTILNVGCGTGYCSKILAEYYPNAHLVNLDLSEGMLCYAKQKLQGKAGHYLCADAEVLPLKEDSIDLVFSSLAIQWCQNYPALFSDLARVSKPKASLYLSTLGPGTLKEVEELWAEVDDKVHVNSFFGIGSLLNIGRQNTLESINFAAELVHRHYLSLRDLSREMKGLGAGNMNEGQSKGLLGREGLTRLQVSFDKQCLEASFRVSFNVVHIELLNGKGDDDKG